LFFPVIGSCFDPILILLIGLVGGFASGFLGVGCGIIITPILMEFGIHPLVAISNQLCHGIGVGMTNFLTYKRRQAVDFHLALYILIGGFIGALYDFIMIKYSTDSFNAYHRFIYIYIVILLIIGSVMLIQGIKAWKCGLVKKNVSGVMMRRWMLYLPLHKIFVRSRTEMSIIIPIFVGFLSGFLAPSLGGGNGLFMVPIITYLIGRISPVVNGTSSFSGCIITGIVAIVHAHENYCCDLLFVMMLFIGATIGSWIGVRLTYNIQRYYINILTSFTVFLMASRQIFRLANNSFSGNLIAPTAPKNSILYTLACITVIVIFAFVSEKTLLYIADKRNKRVAKK
jgi:uncharacterized membrane protein YfcA